METGKRLRNGGQVLVEALAGNGVDTIYCVPGESYLPVLDALHDHPRIRVVVARHEGAAANMADAHGKLSGRPGICFVTRGPGATHAANGVHTAREDSTPMILFVGQVARGHAGREAFQEIDYRQFFGGIAKWVAEVDRLERIPELVARAFAVAMSGRPGPVVVALPEDVLFGEGVAADLPPVRGVIHAAGVEAGALLMNTTSGDIEATMRPKVDGALTLHEVFPPGQLDWMVLFSSCGYLAGFPGQGAYACGNAFLDALARHRRALGDVTSSVAWTAWRGLGMGSTSEFVAAQLDALGMGTVGVDDAMRALDAAMRDGDPNVAVLPVLPAAAAVPMLADVAPAGNQDHDPDGALAPVPEDPTADGVDLAEWAAQRVIGAVAAELGLPEAEVDPRRPQVEIGVD